MKSFSKLILATLAIAATSAIADKGQKLLALNKASNPTTSTAQTAPTWDITNDGATVVTGLGAISGHVRLALDPRHDLVITDGVHTSHVLNSEGLKLGLNPNGYVIAKGLNGESHLLLDATHTPLMLDELALELNRVRSPNLPLRSDLNPSALMPTGEHVMTDGTIMRGLQVIGHVTEIPLVAAGKPHPMAMHHMTDGRIMSGNTVIGHVTPTPAPSAPAGTSQRMSRRAAEGMRRLHRDYDNR